MIDPAVSRLAERNMLAARPRLAASATPRCGCHGLPLSGGPVMWWCATTGATIPAADLDHETHAPLRGGAR